MDDIPDFSSELLDSLRYAERLESKEQQWFILGKTQSGKLFRPSDWAERLAGVMARFRPNTQDSHLCYSPWCVPNHAEGVKCVILSSQLRYAEPMAWDFVIDFAKDNDLQVRQACLLPDSQKADAS